MLRAVVSVEEGKNELPLLGKINVGRKKNFICKF
jgi:hypothetical protein